MMKDISNENPAKSWKKQILCYLCEYTGIMCQLYSSEPELSIEPIKFRVWV